jgi:hypothetical protein
MLIAYSILGDSGTHELGFLGLFAILSRSDRR